MILFLLLTQFSFAHDKNCKDHLQPKAQYVSPQLEERILSSKNGIYMQARRDPSIAIDRNHPIIKDLGTVWDLAKFKTGRAPYSFGAISDPERFAQFRNIRVLDSPIKMRGSLNDYRLPGELRAFTEDILRIIDIEHTINTPEDIQDSYAYLTIDQGYVNPGTSQRRPRAHVDGLQGASMLEKKPINHSYTIANLTPIVYYTHGFDFSHLIDGVHDLYHEMELLADESQRFETLPYHIYLMDAYSVHRAVISEQGSYRTFLRVSYEKEVFDRKGNTHNPLFDYSWKMRTFPRHNVFLPSNYTRDQLTSWMAADTTSGNSLIKFFSQDSEISDLYHVEARGWIGNHSREVIDSFLTQYKYHDLEFLKHHYGKNAYGLFKAMLALHDIGKPLALLEGDKNLQHQFTLPILRKTLLKYGFSEKEVILAETLVEYDLIGDFLKNKINLEKFKEELFAAAGKTELSPEDFFDLMTLFYTVDAGSYSKLRQRLFEENEGQLILSHPLFLELKRTIHGAAHYNVLIDIDQTLVTWRETPSSTSIEVEGEYYEIIPGAQELLAALAQNPKVRVYFFSGREKKRNFRLLKKIQLPEGKTAFELAGAQNIFSKQDLRNLKKDLHWLNLPGTLDQTVILDDNMAYIPEKQRKHLLLVPRTPDRLAYVSSVLFRALAVCERTGEPLAAVISRLQRQEVPSPLGK